MKNKRKCSKCLVLLATVLLFTSCNRHIVRYLSTNEYEGYGYHFKTDNTFQYNYRGCVEHEIGSGTYKIRGNSLILNYQEPKLNRGSYQVQKTRDMKDSIVINLLVLDSIEQTPIISYECKATSEDQTLGFRLGDWDGKVMFESLYKKNMQLHIKYWYSKHNIVINSPGEYDIKLELVNSTISTIREHQRKYKVFQLNNEKMIIGFADEDLRIELNNHIK